MTELPKGPEIPLASGTRGPGVACKHCGWGIPIGGNPAVLSEPFEARCLVCKKLATYQQADICTLEVVLKQ